MSRAEPVIHDISDTALWAAVYRARENERPDALFRDPYARSLAGERGDRIAAGMGMPEKHAWSWITRTYLFDRFIAAQVEQGIDLVVNLAAGLDARPYRMTLPPELHWVEVDLPALLDYKEGILAGERPVCELDRIRFDLRDEAGRRNLFEDLGRRGRRALIIAEGLTIYLTAEEVASLARDLAGPAAFERWVLDLASPGVLRILQKNLNRRLASGGAALKFGPPEGPGFFVPHGWRPVEVHSMLSTAARLRRVPFLLRLAALIPEPTGVQGSRPWAGVVLLERS